MICAHDTSTLGPGPRTRRCKEICHIFGFILLSLVIEGAISFRGPPQNRYCLQIVPSSCKRSTRKQAVSVLRHFYIIYSSDFHFSLPASLPRTLPNRVEALKPQHLPAKTICCYLHVLITSFHEQAAEFSIRTGFSMMMLAKLPSPWRFY